MRRTSALIIALLALAATSGRAQLRPAAILDPAEYLKAFFDAVDAERWLDAAAFIDLQPVERARRDIMLNVRQRPQIMPRMTPEDLMRADPQMPRAVAEYHIVQMERGMNQRREDFWLMNQFANVRDSTELLALSPMELGARWLQAQDQREMYRRTRRENCPDDDPGDLMLRQLVPGREILGALLRGDTAFVLHRAERSSLRRLPEFLSAPAVATLVRRAGTWQLKSDALERHQAVSLGCSIRELRDTSSSRRRPPI